VTKLKARSLIGEGTPRLPAGFEIEKGLLNRAPLHEMHFEVWQASSGNFQPEY
jgi:hypothetical protein